MTIKNLPGSVQARLQNLARRTKRPFQELLQYYAMERFNFDGLQLARAITATFANRGTNIDVAPIAFSPEFTEQSSTMAQWRAFRSRLSDAQCPETLSEVVAVLVQFLLPVAHARADGESFVRHWSPGGPWAAIS